MTVTVIRHGQTDWNVQKKIQGDIDIPLNSKGVEEAHEAIAKLLPLGIGLIYTSPLQRTHETAKIIAAALKKEIITDDRLVERNFGDYQGKTWDEADFPSLCNWDANITPKNGESIHQTYERVVSFLDDITTRHDHTDVLIVVHGHFLKLFNRYFDGAPKVDEDDSGITYNCDVFTYKVER